MRRLILLFLLLAAPLARAERYGIKTPDGQGLYRVVEGTLPEGKDPSEFWVVNPIPQGARFLRWKLLNAVVEPVILVDDPLPTYDSATQKIEPGERIEEPTQVRQTWQVVPLTAEELADKADNTKLQQIMAAIEALEAGTGTAGERITRVERAVAFLLRQEVKRRTQ